MIVAAIKYFLISCEIQTGAFYQIIQLDTLKEKTYGPYSYATQLSTSSMYVFACLFFGNLLDN